MTMIFMKFLRISAFFLPSFFCLCRQFRHNLRKRLINPQKSRESPPSKQNLFFNLTTGKRHHSNATNCRYCTYYRRYRYLSYKLLNHMRILLIIKTKIVSCILLSYVYNLTLLNIAKHCKNIAKIYNSRTGFCQLFPIIPVYQI